MLPPVDICASSVQVHLNIAQKVSKNEEVAEKICHLMSKLRKEGRGHTTSTDKNNVTLTVFSNHIHIIFSKFNKLFKVDYADSSQKQTLEFGQKIEL